MPNQPTRLNEQTTMTETRMPTSAPAPAVSGEESCVSRTSQTQATVKSPKSAATWHTWSTTIQRIFDGLEVACGTWLTLSLAFDLFFSIFDSRLVLCAILFVCFKTLLNAVIAAANVPSSAASSYIEDNLSVPLVADNTERTHAASIAPASPSPKPKP